MVLGVQERKKRVVKSSDKCCCVCRSNLSGPRDEYTEAS